MKKIFIGMAASFLCLSAFAQTVTLVFRGNQSRNYRVMIDGSRYRSGDAVSNSNVYNASVNNNTGVQRAITLNNLIPGSHQIEVYSTANNNGQLVYSNTFQLRPAYNMFITINGTRITFTEKENPAVNANGLYRTAMPSADFLQLLQNVRNNRYQDARASTIRAAIGSTDYFTTDQISQLLSLVSSQDARLELAKAAYAVSADPSNFTQLNSLFNSQVYINSLNDYVRLQMNNNGNNTNNNETYHHTSTRSLLSAAAYDQLLLNLNNNNYQSGKYTIIKDAFDNASYAFTTAQIRQLLGAISSEPDRLYLAKQAYSSVSDPVNFASLLSLFDVQSNRMDLNTYIIGNGETGGNVYVSGRVAMNDTYFNQLLRNSGDHILPWDKYNDVKAAFSDPQNYFTSYQAKQLMSVVLSSGSILSVSESSRVELAKLAYARITDTQNFSQVIDLFSNSSSRDELNNYVRLQASGNY